MADSPNRLPIDLRWILAAVTAVTIVAFPRFAARSPAVGKGTPTEAHPAAENPADKPAAEMKPDASVKTAATLIRDFLAIGLGSGDLADDDKLRLSSVRSLIVTAPDPIDSHLQTDFDQVLSCVQLACQQHDYLLDRYYLPWQQWLQEKDRSTAGRSVYRDHPGVLLMRRWKSKDTKPDILVVFIVGETPISGVHRQAFRVALDEAISLEHPAPLPVCGIPAERKIHLLGPFNSGTSTSIRVALEEWFNHHCSVAKLAVNVISGSAADLGNQARLTKTSAASDEKSLSINFHATVWPTQARLTAICDYLKKDLGLPPEKILLITEFSTIYGSNASRQGGIASMAYPLEVGQMRNAYEQDPLLRAGSHGADSVPGHMRLHVPLGEPLYANDVLPTFSELGPAVTELRLRTILQTISRQGVKAVGLVGTDVRDIIFLVRQLRLHCPDVQLFGIDSHLLFSHEENVDDFEGMLVATTYPLMLDSQGWYRLAGRDSNTGRFQFTSNPAQGVYNAAIAQLNSFEIVCNAPALVDYAVPFGSDTNSNADATQPKCDIHPRQIESECRPPIWLMSVGRDGFSPVTIFQPSEHKCYVYPQSCRTIADTSGSCTPSAIIVSLAAAGLPGSIHLLLAAIACIVAGIVLAAFNEPIEEYPWTALSAVLASVTVKPLRYTSGDALSWCRLSEQPQVRWYALIFFVALLSTLLLLGLAPAMAGLAMAIEIAQQHPYQISIAAAVLVLLVVFDWALAFVTSVSPRNETRVWLWTVIVISVAVFLGLQAMFWDTKNDWPSWLALALLLGSTSAGLLIIYNLAEFVSRKPYSSRDRCNQLAIDAVMLSVLAITGFYLPWYITCLIIAAWLLLALMNTPVQSVGDRPGIGDRFVGLPWRIAPAAIVVVVLVSCLRLHYVADRSAANLPLTLLLELAAKRLGTFSSGVTPIVSLSLLLVLVCFWTVCHLRREFFVNTFSSGLMFQGQAALSGLPPLQVAIQKRLSERFVRHYWIRDVVFAVLGISLLGYIALYRWVPTPEGFAIDMLLRTMIFVGLLIVMGLQIRARVTCTLLRQFLRRLDGQVHLARALDSIPERMKARTAHHLLATPVEPSDIRMMINALRRLLAYPSACTFLRLSYKDLKDSEASLSAQYDGFVESLEPGHDLAQRAKAQSNLSESLSDVTSKLLSGMVRLWNRPADQGKLDAAVDTWRLEAEQFVGMQLARYLNETFAQIRNLLIFLVSTLLLYLWALNSYPFQPSRLISVLSWGLVLWVVASMIVIFVGFSRSGVLSRLLKTDEHRLTWDLSFVTNMVLYVVIPILCLLASQFPEISNLLFKWVGALQQAFHA